MNYHEKYLKYKAKYLSLKNKEKGMKKFIMSGGAKQMNTLYLFKAEWCGHCKAFKPIWEKLKNHYNGKVNFVTFDSEKNKKEIAEYKIDGFPTLILKTGDKAVEYVGPRTEQDIKEFIDIYN